MQEFIQLERDFFQLPDKYVHGAKSDNLDIQSELEFTYGTIKWVELLQEYRAVILAEAGAGKTQEIKHTAQRLRSEGKPAFFLRLENIVSDFELAFEIGSFNQFNNWLNSNSEGWLFLDSVDEARLKHPRDFELAIKKLSSKINIALSRVHIFITSRVSAWRPKSDLIICKKEFPFSIGSIITSNDEDGGGKLPDDRIGSIANELTTRPNEQDETFKVWSIINLSKEQIARFVEHRVVENPSVFINEIERQDAWVYTTRPQDLEEIIEYWNARRKIGSRFELMLHSIQRKLKERDQDREEIASLPLDKARKGVQLLAAASTFLHQSSLLVPDSDNNLGGIDCKQILIDWNANECHVLLGRPIFDEAIYGTVRFHHRTVREFLTAEWLNERLKEFGSRQRIESLFFRLQYDQWIIVPSTKPVLSWLALMDEKIMTRVYKLEPEIILQGGDPARLPLEIRKQILQAVCDKMAKGNASGSIGDQASVQRFANSDLCEDIRILLTTYKENSDVVYYLLQLVGQSHIWGLAGEVKAIVVDKNVDSWVRILAIRTLKIIGSAETFNTVIYNFISEDSALERRIVAEIIDNLESNKENTDWIITAIEKVAEPKSHTSEGLGYALSRFIDRAHSNIVARLIAGIDTLLRMKPYVERSYCHVSARYGWLMPISMQGVEKLVILRDPEALKKPSLFALASSPAYVDFVDHNTPKLKRNLWELIPEWSEFNHQLFWESVEIARANITEENGGRITHEWQVSWNRPYWCFDDKDFETINNDIITRNLADDQLVALSLAFKLYLINKRPRKWLYALKKSVKDNNTLIEALDHHLNPPPPTADVKQFRNQQKQWKYRDNKREEKRKKDLAESMKWLKENVDKLRSENLVQGSISNPQHWLFQKMQEYNSNHSTKWTSGNWKQLIPDYGIEVAEAFRNGLVNFWRHYVPALRSEIDKGNSTPFSIIFGLTAIDIESSEVPDWVQTLNREETALACRYACHELNDFPAWLPRLFQRFPDIVKKIILQEVFWELDYPAESERRLYILHKVGSYGKWLWDDIAFDLLEKLTIDPPNTEYLSYLLNIIQQSSVITDSQLGKKAANKCQSSTPFEQLPYWYATWIGIEPDIAIAALSSSAADLAKSSVDRAKYLVMKTIVTLVGARRTKANSREKYRTAEDLKDLYILTHTYVKVEEDIEHDGVYSPELRDDAQEARRMIFNMLREISGKEAYLALIELSDFHSAANEKIWMLNNARERAEMDADIKPWNAQKFLEFNKDLESSPTNHQELFSLVLQRILDLKFDLEEGDNSIAAILAKEDAETKMRTFIAGWCRDRAAGRYTIAQEDELSDGKKPDIRFFSPLVSCPVPFELKIAEKWTGPALFERLKNQLCGDYLRDSSAGYGILGLVYRGAGKQKWELPESKQEVNFNELIQHLQNHWDKIANIFPGIDRIEVVGIDLTKRFQSERGK